MERRLGLTDYLPACDVALALAPTTAELSRFLVRRRTRVQLAEDGEAFRLAAALAATRREVCVLWQLQTLLGLR